MALVYELREFAETVNVSFVNQDLGGINQPERTTIRS
jgi:hypothetical protein